MERVRNGVFGDLGDLGRFSGGGRHVGFCIMLKGVVTLADFLDEDNGQRVSKLDVEFAAQWQCHIACLYPF